jgi:D-arabinose 1-dehydrogenase-like Zn-dependent alcohol dehydrogenase
MSYSLFKPTIDATGFSPLDFQRIKPGQWVEVFGVRGQYLGVTRAGCVTINYNKAPGMKRQFKSNKPLRQFAILHGSR